MGRLMTQKQNICKDCGESFDSSRALSVHESWCDDTRGDMKETFICKECEKKFESYKSQEAGTVTNDFCSRECKDKNEKNGEFVVCSWCSSSTYKPQSQLSEMGEYSIDNHFCDKECEKLWKQNHWCGENHPSWSGGSTTHRGENWHKQRRMALKRDNYECQVCGCTRNEHYEEYGRDLDVHHKIPAKSFDVLENANYQVNIVTTCRSCHGKLDAISRRELNRTKVLI